MAELLLPVRRAIVAAPSSEPITTAEAKKQCDIATSDTTHDTLMGTLITAARQKWERDIDRVCMSASAVEKLDCFPCDHAIELAATPVQSITSLTYVDIDGNTQTWSSSNYTLDSYRVRPSLVLAYNVSWPTSRGYFGDVTLTYLAGYANAAAVPQVWKQAMLLLIGHWFENRSAVSIGNITNDVPQAYERLTANFMRSTYP